MSGTLVGYEVWIYNGAMISTATTVEQYLAALPEDRRIAISAVREVILKNLDAGYEEGMQYGMIGYYVPHSLFPAGYHCDPRQPLPFAALASQKNYMSLYLMSVYCGCTPETGDGKNAHANWFQEAWRATGKKLDMGKACIRFKKLEEVPLAVIGEAIRRIPAKKWIEIFQAIRPTEKSGAATKKTKAAKAAPRTAAKRAGKK